MQFIKYEANTGMGKTRTCLKLAEKLLNRNKKVMFVADEYYVFDRTEFKNSKIMKDNYGLICYHIKLMEYPTATPSFEIPKDIDWLILDTIFQTLPYDLKKFCRKNNINIFFSKQKKRSR